MRDAATMTACTGYYAVLHTQEVTGSSPAVSTKKFLISSEIRNFFAYIASNRDAVFLRFSLDPNADPKAERSGKHRRGTDGVGRLGLADRQLAVDAVYLLADGDGHVLHVQVRPQQGEELASPQAGGQFQIEGRQQPAPLCFGQIRADLVLRQYFHLPLLQRCVAQLRDDVVVNVVEVVAPGFLPRARLMSGFSAFAIARLSFGSQHTYHKPTLIAVMK